MADIVEVESHQTKAVMEKHFKIPPIITGITKDGERGMYYIQGITIPHLIYSTWSYYTHKTITGHIVGSSSVQMNKNGRRYDVYHSLGTEMPYCNAINKATQKAVKRYEANRDILSSTTPNVLGVIVITSKQVKVALAFIVGIMGLAFVLQFIQEIIR